MFLFFFSFFFLFFRFGSLCRVRVKADELHAISKVAIVSIADPVGFFVFFSVEHCQTQLTMA